MRALLFICFFVITSPLHAFVDFTCLKGTHNVIKDEYKQFSPIYAFMAQESYLESVRLRGNFGRPHSLVKPHQYYLVEENVRKLEAKQRVNPTDSTARKIDYYKRALAQRAIDSPRDPLARLIQHLYLMPALVELAPSPQRSEDWFGSMSLEQLARILNYVITHRGNLVEDELIGVIYASPEQLACPNTKNALVKLLRGNKCFKQRQIAELILDAYDFEDQVRLYPPHIIEHALMALMFWKAETKADLKRFLASMPDVVDQGALAALDDELYTKEDWERATALVEENPQNYLDPEIAVITQAGDAYFNDKIIPLVRQSYAHYVSPEDAAKGVTGKLFANCGEAALNRLFNFFAYDPTTKTFNLERLRRIERRHNLSFNVGLLGFYEKFSDAVEMRKKTVADEWAALVSNLQNVAYNKPADNEYCDIRSFTANHVTVIAHLIGDKILTDLATELRELHEKLNPCAQPSSDEAAEAGSALPPEQQFHEKVDAFWKRLTMLFSEEEYDVHYRAERVELKQTPGVNPSVKSKFTLERSDMPAFTAEYRVMGFHAKFMTSKVNLRSLEDAEGSTDGSDSDSDAAATTMITTTTTTVADDDSDSEHDDGEGFMTNEEVFSCQSPSQTLVIVYLIGNDIPIIAEDESSDEYLVQLAANLGLFSQMYFIDGFFETALEDILPIILGQNLTHFIPLFEKKVVKEIEADHEESLMVFAEYELRYPQSFLAKYKCVEKIKAKIRASVDVATNVMSEILHEKFDHLMLHLVSEDLFDFMEGRSYGEERKTAFELCLDLIGGKANEQQNKLLILRAFLKSVAKKQEALDPSDDVSHVTRADGTVADLSYFNAFSQVLDICIKREDKEMLTALFTDARRLVAAELDDSVKKFLLKVIQKFFREFSIEQTDFKVKTWKQVLGLLSHDAWAELIKKSFIPRSSNCPVLDPELVAFVKKLIAIADMQTNTIVSLVNFLPLNLRREAIEGLPDHVKSTISTCIVTTSVVMQYPVGFQYVPGISYHMTRLKGFSSEQAKVTFIDNNDWMFDGATTERLTLYFDESDQDQSLSTSSWSVNEAKRLIFDIQAKASGEGIHVFLCKQSDDGVEMRIPMIVNDEQHDSLPLQPGQECYHVAYDFPASDTEHYYLKFEKQVGSETVELEIAKIKAIEG